MPNKTLKQIVAEYANRVNAGVRREALATGLLLALTWCVASSGLFTVMAANDALRYKINFKTEMKGTFKQYGDCIWIVAIALLTLTLVSGEFKYIDSRKEARRMAEYIIKRHCKKAKSQDLSDIANSVLAIMSTAERDCVLNLGMALHKQIDRYIAQYLNMEIDTNKKKRLIVAAINDYKDKVMQIVRSVAVREYPKLHRFMLYDRMISRQQ